jgi:hypothetical protein
MLAKLESGIIKSAIASDVARNSCLVARVDDDLLSVHHEVFGPDRLVEYTVLGDLGMRSSGIPTIQFHGVAAKAPNCEHRMLERTVQSKTAEPSS